MLHRGIDETVLWTMKGNQLKVALGCVLKANWKTRMWSGSGVPFEVPRGSFVTSIRRFSEYCDVSHQNLRTSLERLTLNKFITQKSHANFTVISVNSYGCWGSLTGEVTQGLVQELVQGQAQGLDPTNKGKKGKTEKKDTPLTPQGGDGEGTVRKRKAKRGASPGVAEVIKYLNGCQRVQYQACDSSALLIEARLAEGYSARDLRMVAWHQANEWVGTEQEKYLRPDTLYKKSNFEGKYLPAARAAFEKDEDDKRRRGSDAAMRQLFPAARQ